MFDFLFLILLNLLQLACLFMHRVFSTPFAVFFQLQLPLSLFLGVDFIFAGDVVLAGAGSAF